MSSILLICNLPPSSMWPALSTPSFVLSSSLYPFSILPSLHHCFPLSTLVFPIMQMSVCSGALKSRLGPGSLLIVTWLFHRGQQEGGISTCMCTCAWVSVPVIRCSCPSWALVCISFLTRGWWFLHRRVCVYIIICVLMWEVRVRLWMWKGGRWREQDGKAT